MLFTAEHDLEERRISGEADRDRDQPSYRCVEEAGIYPAYPGFQEAGDSRVPRTDQAGRIRRGQGLDYSYGLMMAEEIGTIRSASVPMSIGVQTDMATPALARFGSDELRREFLAPAIAGDMVAASASPKPGRDQDVASIKTTARSRRRRLCHQRGQDVDHQWHPGRLRSVCW